MWLQADEEGIQTATVQEWNPRGFGFVTFLDGRRAYFHHSQVKDGTIGRVNFEVGEQVAAIPKEDAQNPGKWSATEVQRLGSGAAEGVDYPAAAAGIDLSSFSVPGVADTGVVQAGLGGNPSDVQQSFSFPAEQQGFVGGCFGGSVGLEASQEKATFLNLVAEAEAASQSPKGITLFDGSERVEGIVTDWSPKGFGFVRLADERRAYLHASFLEDVREDLQINEAVNAIIVEDAKNPGKWQATRVRRGPAGEDGVVTDWQPSGYGFMEMDDGRKVYIHSSSFGGGDLWVGLRLRVLTRADDRNPGKWCVAEVRAGLTAPLPPPAVANGGAGASGGFKMPIGRALEAAPGGFAGGALIRPVETPAAAPAPSWGQQPSAIMHMMQTMLNHQGSNSFGGKGGKTPTPGLSSGFNTLMQGPSSTLQEAKVKDWDQRGFGFCELPDGRRVYVHHSAFGRGDLEPGEPVLIDVWPDNRDPSKLMAKTLQRSGDLNGVAQVQTNATAVQANANVIGGGCAGLGVQWPGLESQSADNFFQWPALQTPSEEWAPGTVADWHEAKGYGFLAMDDGRRVYVHHSAFGGGSLLVGKRLEAVVVPDEVNPGKWKAIRVRSDDAVLPRPSGGDLSEAKRLRVEGFVG